MFGSQFFVFLSQQSHDVCLVFILVVCDVVERRKGAAQKAQTTMKKDERKIHTKKLSMHFLGPHHPQHKFETKAEKIAFTSSDVELSQYFLSSIPK